MKVKHLIPSLIFACVCSTPSFAQDDLDKMVDEMATPEKEYVTNSFKSSRILMAHSVENIAGGVLDFRILHRFGALSDGVDNLFGLDKAYVRIGLDYGITDDLTVGFGRSSVGKELDGLAKYRIFQQSKGKKSFPITLTAVAGIVCNTDKWANTDRVNFFSSRISYYYQLLMARKFTERLTLQVTPTLIHKNLVPTSDDKNDVFALGLGGRYKIWNRISLNADYFLTLPGQISYAYQNALALGVDIETGGHVFQLQVTNALGMNEKNFITQTTGDWTKGDLHFGFNISRVFTLKTKKGFKDAKNSKW